MEFKGSGFRYILLVFCLVAVMSACKGKQADTTFSSTPTPSPTPGGGGGGGNIYPTDAPFEITVQSAYETVTSVKTLEVDCQVPSSSATYPVPPPSSTFPIKPFGGATGTLPSTTTVKNVTTGATATQCVANIPEGRLHFSRLYFTAMVGSEGVSKGCSMVDFRPYFYWAGNTNAFTPEWSTAAIDCTTTPINPDCFSGAAVSVVPNFPQNIGVYFPTNTSLSMTWESKSANEKNRASNRWFSNDLPSGSRNASVAFASGDNYLGSYYMQDYWFFCRDTTYDPVYTIQLIINDVNDLTGGPYDNWSTWQ